MIWVRRTARFCWRVIKRFGENKGLLLASAVGYNALLSLIPLFAVALIALSRMVDHQVLIHTVSVQLEALVPGSGRALAGPLRTFVEGGHLAGGLGLLLLFIFATLAFRMLEDAIFVVFQRRRRRLSRHPLASGLISLSYVGVVVLSLFGLTTLSVVFETLPAQSFRLLGWRVSAAVAYAVVLRVVVFVGMVALLASFYRFLPVVRIKTKHALIGGLVAGTMLEVVRTSLVYYFANISLVGVIYGSLATVIVALLTFEICAIILLLGAQVIAEIERAASAGLLWYEEPPLSEWVAPTLAPRQQLPIGRDRP